MAAWVFNIEDIVALLGQTNNEIVQEWAALLKPKTKFSFVVLILDLTRRVLPHIEITYFRYELASRKFQ